jgi:hypothetical protein
MARGLPWRLDPRGKKRRKTAQLHARCAFGPPSTTGFAGPARTGFGTPKDQQGRSIKNPGKLHNFIHDARSEAISDERR